MTRRIENTVNVSHQKTLKALSHERVIILLFIAAVHVTPFTVFAPVHSQAPCHLPSPVRGATTRFFKKMGGGRVGLGRLRVELDGVWVLVWVSSF